MLPVAGYMLLGILLFLFVLLLLPAHVRVRYDRTVKIWGGLGPVSLCLYPGKKKAKPKKEKTKTAEGKKREKKNSDQKPKFTAEILCDYIRLGAQALGKLRRRLVIRDLVCRWSIGGPDAAGIALTYGRVAAAVSALYPVLDRNLRIKNSEIAVDADFESGKSDLFADVTIAACPLRLLIAGIVLLTVFLKIRKKQTSQSTDEKGGILNEQHQ